MNTDDRFLLQTSRLKVQISKPGAFYAGSRFDHNGFITDVTLDGKHTFCAPESLTKGQGSGGCGLCGEFGIESAVGYEDAGEGEGFIKIGVGQLIKPDSKPYDFFYPYEVIPAGASVTATAQSVRFGVAAAPCNGYAYEYEKTVSVDDNTLRISYALTNKGDKLISTTEYCHNFLAIDGRPIDRGYELTLSGCTELNRRNGEAVFENGVVTWPEGERKTSFYCLPDFRTDAAYTWQLIHTQAGAGVRESVDFSPCKVALWGCLHVVSPEVFVRVDLVPGRTQTWTRTYEFFNL